jgi:hypothetical protein
MYRPAGRRVLSQGDPSSRSALGTRTLLARRWVACLRIVWDQPCRSDGGHELMR